MTISEEKTKITNTYRDKVLFLGTNIRHALIYNYYKTKQGITKRALRQLLMTAPLARIRKKFTEAGYVAANRPKSRVK